MKKFWTWLKKIFSLPNSDPSPPVVLPYIVQRGKNEMYTLKTPALISFDIAGMGPTNDQVEAHLLCGVEAGKDWAGGNPQPAKEVYAFSAKDYKLKCNGFGEFPFYGPAATWDKMLTYHVEVKIGEKNSDGKTITVETISLNGKPLATASVVAPNPPLVDVWKGWPPGNRRNGCEGARITNWKAEGQP